uniref:Putative secreted peptide n=1 Tax=Anopheles braziliensis TaxID=58242 RepID=A0A2M3ZP24_9DIPT
MMFLPLEAFLLGLVRSGSVLLPRVSVQLIRTDCLQQTEALSVATILARTDTFLWRILRTEALSGTAVPGAPYF